MLALCAVAVGLLACGFPATADAGDYSFETRSFSYAPHYNAGQSVYSNAGYHIDARTRDVRHHGFSVDALELLDRATLNGLVDKQTIFAVDEYGDLFAIREGVLYDLRRTGTADGYFETVGFRSRGSCNNSRARARANRNRGNNNGGVNVNVFN
jgi:hypothetical protein